MQKNQNRTRTIAASLGSREDQAEICRILALPEWNVHLIQSISGLWKTLQDAPPRVIIADKQLPDGHDWKEIIQGIAEWRNPPQLIVAHRFADEALWAEVINLGGYDLLMTPFEPEEAHRVVSRAWEFQIREAERTKHSPGHARRRESVTIRGFAASA